MLGDLSTNNWWVNLFAFGDGWHNTHHAFPFSARHGLEVSGSRTDLQQHEALDGQQSCKA
jgi:hypothetical protein